MAPYPLIPDPPVELYGFDLSRKDREYVPLHAPGKPAAERARVEVFSESAWATGTLTCKRAVVGASAALDTAVSFTSPGGSNPAAVETVDDLAGVERLVFETGTTQSGERVRVRVTLYRPAGA